MTKTAARRFACITTYQRRRSPGTPPRTDTYACASLLTPEQALRAFFRREDLLALGDILPRALRHDLRDRYCHMVSLETLHLQSRAAQRLLDRMSWERLLRAAVRFGICQLTFIDIRSWEQLWSFAPAAELKQLQQQRQFCRDLEEAPELVVVHELDADAQIRAHGSIGTDDLYLLMGERCYFLFTFAAPGADGTDSFVTTLADDTPADPGYPAEPDVPPTDWTLPDPVLSTDEYPALVRQWLSHYYPSAAGKPIRLATAAEAECGMTAIMPEVSERLEDCLRCAERRLVLPLRVRRPTRRWLALRANPRRLCTCSPRQSQEPAARRTAPAHLRIIKGRPDGNGILS